MKKILALGAMMGVACGAFAQGTVLFDNNFSGTINYQTTVGGALTAVSAIGAGSNPGAAIWNVALLFNATPGGGIAQSSLIELADYRPNVANGPSDGAGFFQDTAAGKEVTITTPSGSGTATFEVVSWLGTATTWAAALTPGSGTTYATQGANLVEFTAKIANPTSVPPGIPSSINSGSGQWNGNLLLTPTTVPEPSTIALGGLGAAALLLFRRRK
jgi:hypothetical protein